MAFINYQDLIKLIHTPRVFNNLLEQYQKYPADLHAIEFKHMFAGCQTFSEKKIAKIAKKARRKYKSGKLERYLLERLAEVCKLIYEDHLKYLNSEFLYRVLFKIPGQLGNPIHESHYTLLASQLTEQFPQAILNSLIEEITPRIVHHYQAKSKNRAEGLIKELNRLGEKYTLSELQKHVLDGVPIPLAPLVESAKIKREKTVAPDIHQARLEDFIEFCQDEKSNQDVREIFSVASVEQINLANLFNRSQAIILPQNHAEEIVQLLDDEHALSFLMYDVIIKNCLRTFYDYDGRNYRLKPEIVTALLMHAPHFMEEKSRRMLAEKLNQEFIRAYLVGYANSMINHVAMAGSNKEMVTEKIATRFQYAMIPVLQDLTLTSMLADIAGLRVMMLSMREPIDKLMVQCSKTLSRADASQNEFLRATINLLTQLKRYLPSREEPGRFFNSHFTIDDYQKYNQAIREHVEKYAMQNPALIQMLKQLIVHKELPLMRRIPRIY